MKNLNFLIKPASSLCNMRCRYCFYEDEAVNRAEASTGRMTTETVDCLIQQAFAALDNRNSSVTFAFQGGEPTLAGLDYYRYFVEKVYQHNVNHVHVNFAIQTNGLMIDEQWAVFLAANRFLVGISMDGTKAQSFRTGSEIMQQLLLILCKHGNFPYWKFQMQLLQIR